MTRVARRISKIKNSPSFLQLSVEFKRKFSSKDQPHRYIIFITIIIIDGGNKDDDDGGQLLIFLSYSNADILIIFSFFISHPFIFYNNIAKFYIFFVSIHRLVSKKSFFHSVLFENRSIDDDVSALSLCSYYTMFFFYFCL